jgi:hypothetical protein
MVSSLLSVPPLWAPIQVTQVVSRRSPRPAVLLSHCALVWWVDMTETAATVTAAARDTVRYWKTSSLVIITLTILRRGGVEMVCRGVRWWQRSRWDAGRRRCFQCWIGTGVIVQVRTFCPSLSPFSVVSTKLQRLEPSPQQRSDMLVRCNWAKHLNRTTLHRNDCTQKVCIVS